MIGCCEASWHRVSNSWKYCVQCIRTRSDEKSFVGGAAIAFVILTWTLAGFYLQAVLTHYPKPLCVSMLCLSCTPVLFPVWKMSHQGESLRQTLRASSRVAVPFACFFVIDQTLYNASLKFLTVPTSEVVASTNILMLFFLSLCFVPIGQHAFRLIVLIITFGGLALVGLAHPRSQSHSEYSVETDTVLGFVLGLLAATSYSVSVIFLKVMHAEDVSELILVGCAGVVTSVLFIPIIGLAHLTGVERFQVPSLSILLLLLGEGVFLCASSNWAWAIAANSLSPTMMAVGTSLCLPLSIFIDSILMEAHGFPLWYVLGSVATGFGVLTTAILDSRDSAELDGKDEDSTTPSCRPNPFTLEDLDDMSELNDFA
ncbi:MAG: hypothetical protein KVP17_001872 [Porospora cf. gigantea B]|uniref:uncharacterized protein n=1 Tax=Porospora cf. gigantea B TaxID=2853592 RepID=UPI003571C58E|nr:MAG: hypothetical protein KVP17_001872 [Porospora cf. gigantea B]